jgi:hypothetical protein
LSDRGRRSKQKGKIKEVNCKKKDGILSFSSPTTPHYTPSVASVPAICEVQEPCICIHAKFRLHWPMVLRQLAGAVHCGRHRVSNQSTLQYTGSTLEGSYSRITNRMQTTDRVGEGKGAEGKVGYLRRADRQSVVTILVIVEVTGQHSTLSARLRSSPDRRGGERGVETRTAIRIIGRQLPILLPVMCSTETRRGNSADQ